MSLRTRHPPGPDTGAPGSGTPAITQRNRPTVGTSGPPARSHQEEAEPAKADRAMGSADAASSHDTRLAARVRLQQMQRRRGQYPSPEPTAGRQAARRRAGSIRRMDRPLAAQTASGVTASEPSEPTSGS